MLDQVTAEAKSLQLKLGHTDRHKLDEYLTGVAELERQVGLGPGAQCMAATAPAATNDFRAKLTALSDLMVLALQCDATRIIAFMLGNAISGQSYPFLTVNGSAITRGHHDISHHGNQQANLDQLAAINLWTMEQFAAFLTKLKGVKEGAGTLLDNTAIFLSSDVPTATATTTTTCQFWSRAMAAACWPPGNTSPTPKPTKRRYRIYSSRC